MDTTDKETGGMSNIENQSAIQSILESQTVADPAAQAECEDLFQCGKCKKQFTAVETFMTHKRSCAVQVPTRPTYQPVQSLTNNSISSAFSAAIPHTVHRPQATQTLQNYSTVPQSPLNQLTSSMVLTDDQMLTFSGLDQTVQSGLLQTSTLHLAGSAVQTAGPFLSQMAQLNNRASENMTILSPVQSGQSLAPSNGSAFTSTVSVSNMEPLVHAPQHIAVATLHDKPQPVQTVIKPSPTKAGRKSAQANLLTVMEDHNMAVNKRRSRTFVAPASNEEANNKKKICNFCGKAFSKNFDLQQHIRAHTGEKPYQCIVCGRAFAQKSNVKKHMATHKVWPTGPGVTLPSQPPALLVPMAGRSDSETSLETGTQSQPTAHQSSQDQVITVWSASGVASTRSATTTSSQSGVTVLASVNTVGDPILPEESSAMPIRTPGQTNQGGVTQPYPGVEVEGNQAEDLEGQEEEEQEEEEEEKEDVMDKDSNSTKYKLKVVIDNSYLCQYCSEKFKSYFQLKTHMVKHKSEQVYKCVMQKCNKTFKDLDSFLEHTTSHQDEMAYRCHQCNKTFASLYDLGVHQFTHSLYPQQAPKPGPRHFQCNDCMNKYATPEALEHHLATTDHKFPCPHCEKVFSCERYLRRHLPSHGTEGQFQCVVCQKCFKTEYYLKMHALIHSGEKPFQCEECGAAFNRKDKLKRHSVIHDKRIRYKCPFKGLVGCTKEFNRPDKLKAHIISHSGIKPYSCGECGKEFSRRPHLTEHERGHRAEYRYTCEKCGRGFFRPKLFKEHRCVPRKDGQSRGVFRPRPNKRKPGRPKTKKRMITVTAESVKQDEPRKRGRPRTVAASKPDVKPASAGQQEEPNRNDSKPDVVVSSADVIETVTVDTCAGDMFTTPSLDTPVLEGPAVEVTTDSQVELPKQKKSRTECYVKTTPPASMMEHFVTVHLSNTAQATGNNIQTHLIQTATPSHVQISPSSSSSLPPFTIIEAQPVHITVAHGDQLGALGDSLSSIPVDIVTVSDESALIGSQEVVGGDGNPGQTYVTCEASMEAYNPGDTDPVLQGTESLINPSADILQAAHTVHEISLENV